MVSTLRLHVLARHLPDQDSGAFLHLNLTDFQSELKQFFTCQLSFDKGGLNGRVLGAHKYEDVLKIPGCCFCPQSIHGIFELAPEVSGFFFV
jgi:hypothetical protein